MKVVHLSQTDEGAGAGRAAYRIHRGILELGFDSSMIVADRRTNDPTVHCAWRGRIGRLLGRLDSYRESKFARTLAGPQAGYFSPAGFGRYRPDRDARVRDADIVCLYWINGGFMAPEALTAIGRPIVWRLSDTWPFTGGCHFPGQCVRYRDECGYCPQLARPAENDLSRKLWARKRDSWKLLDLTLVAPSQWIADLAAKSSLFGQQRVDVIHTGVDLTRYKPIGRAEARMLLGLPQDRLIVMFGAISPSNDARKGYAILCSALEELYRGVLAPRLLGVVFGDVTQDDRQSTVMPLHFLGHLRNDEQLATAYSAADVLVVPSLEDNLPNVALESIACGTPVVGFAVGGMPDAIRSGWNGILVDRQAPSDLAAGIHAILRDDSVRASYSVNARKWAEQNFDHRRQVDRISDLFLDLAAKKNRERAG